MSLGLVFSEDSFRYQFFQNLAIDFINTPNRSTIFEFLKEEKETAAAKLKEEIDDAASIEGKYKILESSKAPALVRFICAHFLMTEGTMERIVFIAFAFLTASENGRLGFIGELNGDDKIERFVSYLNELYPLICPDTATPLSRSSSKVAITSAISAMSDALKNGPVSKECLRLLSDKNGEIIAEGLYSIMLENALYSRVKEFFSDNECELSGEGIRPKNIRSPKKGIKNGRAPRHDKTMLLLEKAVSTGLMNNRFSTKENGESYNDKCIALFEALNHGSEKDFGNVFIPIFVDERTGNSLAIVGRNHYPESETRNSDSVCSLAIIQQVVELSDDTDYDISGPRIVYRSDYEFDFFSSENPDTADSFDAAYKEFCETNKNTMEVFRGDNSGGNLPEGIDRYFIQYFRAKEGDLGVKRSHYDEYDAMVGALPESLSKIDEIGQKYDRKYGRLK